MSDNKKYYYLKLKENFFDSKEIKVLESMPNGYKYSNLLLKLYLKSLEYEGMLRLNEYIPYNKEMIAAVTNSDLDTVKVALDLFQKLKLIEILEDGTIFMLEIQNFIGESSTEADRKRAFRKRIDNEKKLLTGQTSGQMSQQTSDKNPPELEIEIELELEKDNNIKSCCEQDDISQNSIPYKDIINYLNNKANTKYRSSSKKTKALIKSRFNENFTFEDFKKVIDIKTFEWKGTDFEKYLRPGTLFGTKFEDYLNQKVSKNNNVKGYTTNKKTDSFSNRRQRKYDLDKIEKTLLGWYEDEE